MVDDFEKVLDDCIDRINRGEKPEQCMSDHPEYAAQLEPLLRSLTLTLSALSFTPSDDARRTARHRLYTALDKKRRPSFWQRMLARHTVLAGAAGVLVIMIVSYFALRTTLFPGDPGWEYVPGSASQPPSEYVATPGPDGNFVFLVSDDVNAISDFSSLTVTVERVGLLQGGTSEKWQEFIPEVKEFDLTLLPGEKTQELWRGDVPEGQYNKVFIYISGVSGTLKTGGEAIAIKLPGNKLQLSRQFQVSRDRLTIFTYDLTAVKTGSAKNAGDYLLKPQVGESGASQQPLPKYGPEKPGKGLAPPDTSPAAPVNTGRRK
jgi:hypothetical protein